VNGATLLRPTRDLAAFTSTLAMYPDERAAAWEPIVFAVAPGESDHFRASAAAQRLVVVDRIDRQLTELARIRYPADPAVDVRERFVRDALGEVNTRDAIGAWVWYPWTGRVVHLLSQPDYLDVITDRNRDKITADEQATLLTRRVGVIGLSVGAEAAVTVAQEHCAGAIRIADFDELDLSNLNRLSAACDEIGVKKTTLAARRIALLNPWLTVEVWPDGVPLDRIDEYLDGLDLLLEECDGMPIKVAARQAARRRGLNVIQAADERGFLSVEPYGHDATLPVFHGRLTEPLRARHEYTSNAEFLRALTVWVGGWDAVSRRTQASLAAVGVTRSGFPQLAGEARFAAGQVAHVARRLLLGERVRPMATHMDLNELIPSVA
jgi:tRNA threonylcarbamoyladenosine dehydratase